MSFKTKNNSFLRDFKKERTIFANTNLDNFIHGANKTVNRKHHCRNINLSTISFSNHNNRKRNANSENKGNILSTHLCKSSDKNKIDDLKKNILVENKQLPEYNSILNLSQISDKLLRKLNKILNKSHQISNNTNSQKAFKNQAKELLNIINQPTHSPCKKKNNIKKMPNKGYKTIYSRNSLVSSSSQAFNLRAASSSNFKIEKMKRYIENLFPQKTAINFDKKQLFNNDAQEEEQPKKKNIFEPSYRRKIKNKMYDFKNFKIFVDYNERKQNLKNLLAFAKNNQIIMSSIQSKFAENKQEGSIEHLDEDINVDDLIEDTVNQKIKE